MTQMESKPTSSAVRTIWAKVGPIAWSPPGQEKESICSPIFIGRRVPEVSRGS